MGINSYLTHLAIAIIVIFGGTFIVRYCRTGELLIDQIIGGLVGIVLLMGTRIWEKINNGAFYRN